MKPESGVMETRQLSQQQYPVPEKVRGIVVVILSDY